MRISLFPTVQLATWLLTGVVVSPVDARTIGNHEAVYDADGALLPWTTLDGSLWVQFFEDYDDPNNRTAWAPLNLARYLIEEKESLDPEWSADAGALIQFTERFTSTMDGIVVCGEQDRDIQPWGGVHSTFGAVLAMYSAATGSDQYRRVAYEALNYSLYAIADRGCARDASFEGEGCGIWQEDAHTDVIHNFMDAIAAFPGWAR